MRWSASKPVGAVDPKGWTTWEGPSLQVVLYQPEIPQNTGNVARTCAATHTPLHLVEPLGFRITDRHLKRAGLDYWPRVTLSVHPDVASLHRALPKARRIFFSARATRSVYDFQFRPGDCLIFGCETGGLPKDLLDQEPENVLQIPIDRSQVRSLNLATSVGVVLFEAMRQLMLCQALSGSSHDK
jgi:tRNA (cytidine/uridine-2'-O-)-methyltransferase